MPIHALTSLVFACAACAQLPVATMRYHMLGIGKSLTTADAPGGTCLVENLVGATRKVVVALDCLTWADWTERQIFASGISDGLGKLVQIERTAVDLVVVASSDLPATPVRLVVASEHIAVLGSDGTFWAAPRPALGDPMPPLSAWTLVAGDDVTHGSTAHPTFTLLQTLDKIGFSHHPPLTRTVWFEQSGESWQRVPSTTHPYSARLTVQVPVIVGRPLEYRTNVAGPVFLECAELGLIGRVDQVGTEPQFLVPEPVGGHRYRLVCQGTSSPWFSPLRVNGSSWARTGFALDEIGSQPDEARLERGTQIFSAHLTVQPDQPLPERIVTVLLVRAGGEAPQIETIGGHDWLRPDAALLVENATRARQRIYPLANSVPLVRGSQPVGSWVHAQLVALDQAGQILAATGISSVQILPDTGGNRIANFEERMREACLARWQAHGVPDVEAFWQALTNG